MALRWPETETDGIGVNAGMVASSPRLDTRLSLGRLGAGIADVA
jgi:hypothetical protein